MTRINRLAVVVAACGSACGANAQDSVSKFAALPGDALSPYDTAEVCNSYVVDMVPLTGSWGTALRIAPIMKGTKVSSGFYNNLISAQAISKDLTAASSFPSASYSSWTLAGQGINAQNNTAPGSTSPTGASLQFGVAFADFGTTDAAASYNGVHGAMVNYKTSDDNRLYVTRRSAATNGAVNTENLSQFGMGVIDSHGNLTFRADDFGTAGATRLLEDNIFRVRLAARGCGTINRIDNTGGLDAGATDWLVKNSTTTYSIPSMLPQSVAGRPVYTGPNFAAQYAYEIAANTVVATNAHLQGSTDHRGGMGVSNKVWFGRAGAVATLGIVSKSAAGGGENDSISVWDVDANGTVLNPGAALRVPCSLSAGGSITDNDDGYVISAGASGWSINGVGSQTAFRGGSGHVALMVDAAGNRLASSTVYDASIGGNNNPSNAIVVAKHDPGTGTTGWTLAAYYDANAGIGKQILDGPSGTPIGQLTGLFNVTGGSPLGPSLSMPAFDCAGNIYFVAAVEFFTGLDQYDVALVRAVYDPATFGYQLELIASSGFTFTGANSATPYQITFINLADSDSIDSASFFSHNVSGACWGNTNPAGLNGTTDPLAVGGVLLNARITYDSNGDTTFDNAIDENYRAVLFIASGASAFDPCDYADFNNNGTVNTQDVSAFLNAWTVQRTQNCSGGGCSADCNGNGTVNTQDVTCFLNLWTSCR